MWVKQSWFFVEQRYILMSFSFLKDLSAEATISGIVRNTFKVTVKFGNALSRFPCRIKFSLSMAFCAL